MDLILPKSTSSKNKSVVTGDELGNSKFGLHVIAEGAGVAWDRIDATYPTASSEVYTYSLNGTTVRTVTVTYTDATKEVLTSIERS
jgi:hypothetical protein